MNESQPSPLLAVIAADERRQLQAHVELLQLQFSDVQRRLDKIEEPKSEETLTNEDAVFLLHRLQSLIEAGMLASDASDARRQALVFCMKKGQALFQGQDLQTTERKPKNGYYRIIDYPPDGQYSEQRKKK